MSDKVRKIILASVLTTIVTLNFTWVKPAQAFLGFADQTFNVTVGDIPRILWQTAGKIAEVFLDRLKNKMIDALQNDMVNWVQGGGRPRFVTDPKKFLSQAADQAAVGALDQYFRQHSQDICSSFRPQLQLLVQNATFVPEFGARCTLGSIVNNLQNFSRNFNDGGWKTWISLHETQNTLPGSYLTGIQALRARTTTAQNSVQSEVSAGKGFLNQKNCLQYQIKSALTGLTAEQTLNLSETEYQQALGEEQLFEANIVDVTLPPNAEGTGGQGKADGIPMRDLPDNATCIKTKTVTPGAIIGDQLSGTLKGTGIDKLISAQRLGELINAIIDAAINRVAKEGLSLMRSGAGSDSKAPPPAYGTYQNTGTVPQQTTALGSNTQASTQTAQLLNDAIGLKTKAQGLASAIQEINQQPNFQTSHPDQYKQLQNASPEIQSAIAFVDKTRDGLDLYTVMLLDYDQAGTRAQWLSTQQDLANDTDVSLSPDTKTRAGLKVRIIEEVNSLMASTVSASGSGQLGLSITDALSQAMTVLENPDRPGQKLLPGDIFQVAAEINSRTESLKNIEKTVREIQGGVLPNQTQ